MPSAKYLFSKLMHKIQIPAVIKSDVDSTARICSKSHVYHSSIGAYSYIGNDCKIFSSSIGKYCSIADGCFLGGAQHPINHVSTSPVFHKGKNVMGVNFATHDDPPAKGIIIGNDVWIGANTLIKDGITIGDGAVIGMGSVLTHNVPPYEIWGGNPAKKIRDRFDKKTAEELLKIKWWNMSEEELMQYTEFFDNPGLLLETYKKRLENGK